MFAAGIIRDKISPGVSEAYRSREVEPRAMALAWAMPRINSRTKISALTRATTRGTTRTRTGARSRVRAGVRTRARAGARNRARTGARNRATARA